jgi:hypothetical protein
VAIDDAWEKLSAAVRHLATMPDRIQDRVCDAFTLAYTHPDPDQYPEDMFYEFQDVRNRLTRKGSIGETTNDMTDDEAIEIAKKLFDMYERTAAKYYTR